MTPRPMHSWRCFLLRLFGAKIRKNVKIYASARIWAPWNLQIEEGAIIGDHVECYSVAPITIGTYSIISQGTTLCTATHDHRSETFTLIAKPITIGNSAWIASRAFINPGIHVGDNAIVAACSVVIKNVVNDQTVAGNPARDIEQVKQELEPLNLKVM